MDVDLAAEATEAGAWPETTGNHAPQVQPRPVLPSLQLKTIGSIGPDGSVSVRRGEPARWLLVGPLWRLSAGRYRLSFRCDVSRVRRPLCPVLAIEIIALQRMQQGFRDFTATELIDGSGFFEFEVPDALSVEASELTQFDFRFIHLGNADLTIRAVDLQPVEAKAPLAPSGWRLLGRLRKTQLGRYLPDGIVVRRFEPPGCVLYGGRPFVQLAEGRYRLNIACRAVSPRAPHQAVLGLQIAALRGRIAWDWRRLYRRQSAALDRQELVSVGFTAADLAAGPVSLDIDVPLAFGVETGEAPWLEFKLFHTGNCDLEITGLDLERLDPGASVAPLPIGSPFRALTMRARRPSPQRRNLLIIGNCQGEWACEAFRRAPALRDKFSATYQFVHAAPGLHSASRRLLESADLLLVQDIKLWDSYPLREFIPAGIEIIKFPLIHFASLWPFDGNNGPTDMEARTREWPDLKFEYLDGLLGRLRHEIPDKEARFAAYRSLEVDGIVDCRRVHDFERRRWLAIDRKFDCQIGQFILDNFQSRKLFCTTYHPDQELFAIFVTWLMRRLGVDGSFAGRLELIDYHRRTQVPVHPEVARRLGVVWADENTRYPYEGRMVTWEEYTRAYIDHYG